MTEFLFLAKSFEKKNRFFVYLNLILTDTSLNSFDFSSVLNILFSGINLKRIQFIFMSIIICCTQKFNSPSQKNYLSLFQFPFRLQFRNFFSVCVSWFFFIFFYWTTILLFFMRVGIEANCVTGRGEKAKVKETFIFYRHQLLISFTKWIFLFIYTRILFYDFFFKILRRQFWMLCVFTNAVPKELRQRMR